METIHIELMALVRRVIASIENHVLSLKHRHHVTYDSIHMEIVHCHELSYETPNHQFSYWIEVEILSLYQRNNLY